MAEQLRGYLDATPLGGGSTACGEGLEPTAREGRSRMSGSRPRSSGSPLLMGHRAQASAQQPLQDPALRTWVRKPLGAPTGPPSDS